MAQSNFEKIFNLNNALYFVALLIALWFSVNTIRVIERNYSLEQEVGSLQEEVSILELENERLKYNIAYFETDDYLEATFIAMNFNSVYFLIFQSYIFLGCFIFILAN
jgi:FtsZ-binding cell division protein ZapB